MTKREATRYALAVLILAAGMTVGGIVVGLQREQQPDDGLLTVQQACNVLGEAGGPMMAAVPLISKMDGMGLDDGVAARGLARELEQLWRSVTDARLKASLDTARRVANARMLWSRDPGTPWEHGPMFDEAAREIGAQCGTRFAEVFYESE